MRALLIHSEPDEIVDVLERAADLEWRMATTPDEVDLAVEEHEPQVVFSIKHSGLAGDCHRRALHAPGLQWFHVGGSGRDHLGDDVPQGVLITDCAGVLAPFLAERAMAALLHLSTGLDALIAAGARREWEPSRFRSLDGRNLLIVGAGHTGTALAARARPFGMHVIGVRTSGEPQVGFHEIHPPSALDALLPKADVLSLHVRLDARTDRLIGARELALLPEGAIVMNSARGRVLDEVALIDALEQRVEAAWLDVFAEEPLPRSSPLWSHQRVLVTPHCADQTVDFPRRFAERFVGLYESHFASGASR